MATTIKSTALDFFDIKDSLKLFFQQREEFKDYDFEGSGLSNILDVLAHNTHFNGLIANFALNESYLTTAQLRNSIVSLAESLGYIPSSKTSSQCTVNVTINLAGVEGLEQVYHLLPGELVLRGSIDDQEFVFTNRETITADANGTGIYEFHPFERPDDPITVVEGEIREQEYVVDASDNAVYIIPDQNIDLTTAIVKVYDNRSVANSKEGAYTLYNNIFDAVTIDEMSRLYILRESPNRFYELTFGSNNSLGQTPVSGNIININYLRSSGQASNGVGNLKLGATINLPDQNQQRGHYEVQASDVSVVTLTRASGGDEPEDIESIRKRAPFQYAAQNRMITPLDYEALILRKYQNYIEDIICWGGEDDYRRDFGAVYVSIVWKSNLSSVKIGELREEIRELGKNLSVVSFIIKFVDASETFLSTEVYYRYNPTLSANSQSTVNQSVRDTINNYVNTSIGKFQQSFRRSNLLTLVDDTDPSILSSRADIKMQKRIFPILSLTESFQVVYPVPLKDATDSNVPVVTSSLFQIQGKTVYIRNKLTDRVKVSPEGQLPIVFDRLPSTKLEIVDLDNNVVVSNTGSYDPSSGTVNINKLQVQSILSANNYIKIFAIPANESAIESKFNNILRYDEPESLVKAVTVDAKD
jgi:hypothetical protein